MRSDEQATFGAPPDAPDYVPGQIIVRVHEQAVRPHVGELHRLERRALDDLPEAVIAPLHYLLREVGARSVEPVFSERSARIQELPLPRQARHELAVAASVADAPEGLSGINLIQLPKTRVTPELLRALRSSRAIAYAEAVPARWLQAADPMRNRQWGLRAIHCFEASPPDASHTTVAVIDSGIDVSHPDFSGVSIDYDHEGAGAADILGHGTHVAGIIGARTNNDVGISGIARCLLAVWKVTPDEPDARGRFVVQTVPFLRALNAVGASGARVVNLSLGGRQQSRAEQDVFASLETRGITCVAAIGNEFQSGNPTDYPGAYPKVLAVGAVDEIEVRAPYSNTGRQIGLVAPGSNILSTVPMRASKYRKDTAYTAWSGTSMAAAHVSAAAALLLTSHPYWSPSEVRERLLETAKKLPDMKGNDWTSAYGKGLLDLAAALS